MIKSITLRLPKAEYDAFDTICAEKGYSKTGKIREFIRNLVKDELPSIALSVKEWERLSDAIKEIERGEFVSLEDLKRDLAKKEMANRKDRK